MKWSNPHPQASPCPPPSRGGKTKSMTSSNTLQLKIVTPQGIAYNDVAKAVTLRTTDGEITVLPNHIPLITLLDKGTIRIKGEHHNDKIFNSEKGVIEVRKGSEVIILSEGTNTSP